MIHEKHEPWMASKPTLQASSDPTTPSQFAGRGGRVVQILLGVGLASAAPAEKSKKDLTRGMPAIQLTYNSLRSLVTKNRYSIYNTASVGDARASRLPGGLPGGDVR